MGWKNGKKEVIVPAAGGTIVLDEPGAPVVPGKRLINDISGVLHKASKRDAKTVVLEGTSKAAEQYIADYLDSQYALAASAIVVFDGAPYPPKLSTQEARRKGLDHFSRGAQNGYSRACSRARVDSAPTLVFSLRGVGSFTCWVPSRGGSRHSRLPR